VVFIAFVSIVECFIKVAYPLKSTSISIGITFASTDCLCSSVRPTPLLGGQTDVVNDDLFAIVFSHAGGQTFKAMEKITVCTGYNIHLELLHFLRLSLKITVSRTQNYTVPDEIYIIQAQKQVFLAQILILT